MVRNTRQHLLMPVIAAALLLLINCAPVWADEIISQSGMKYSSTQVLGIFNGALRWQDSYGNVQNMPLERVGVITLSAGADFNYAEQFMSLRKFTEAVAAYDQTMSKAANPSAQRLVRYRRLQALDQAGQTDRAVEDWLTTLSETGDSDRAMALRPRNLAPKGSSRNAKAIELLETALAGPYQVNAEKPIKQLLVELYTRQGRADKVDALRIEPAASQAANGDTSQPTASAPAGASGDALIKAAGNLIENHQPDKALAEIVGGMNSLDRSQMPQALMLAGLARRELSATADQQARRQMLAEAGLDFMKVAVHYSHAPEAAQCLYLAAQTNAELGNLRSADVAYRQVVTQYPKTPWAANARKALESMGARQ